MHPSSIGRTVVLHETMRFIPFISRRFPHRLQRHTYSGGNIFLIERSQKFWK